MREYGGYGLLLLVGLALGIVAGKLGLAYGVLLGGALAVGMGMLLRPSLGLYFLAGYAVLDYGFRITGGMLAGLWDELLFFGVVATYVGHLIVRGKALDYRLTALDVPIFIFAGVSIFLLLFNSPELHIAIDGIRVVIQYLLWYFVAINLIRDKLVAKRILNILLWTTVLISFHGIYQYVVGVEIPTSWYDSRFETSVTTRVFSIIGSPNILGSLLVLMIPINLAFVINEQRWVKKLMYFGGPLAVGGAIIMLAVPQIGDRIAYMLSPQYMESSARGGRIARWTMAIEAIKANPWFGEGIGRFGGATAMRHIPGSLYTDNFYLKTLAEMGIVGFTAFIYLLYRGCIEAARVLRQLKEGQDRELFNLGVGIFTGLIGVLAHNGVENVFEVPMMSSYFWLLLAMIISFRYMGVKAGG